MGQSSFDILPTKPTKTAQNFWNFTHVAKYRQIWPHWTGLRDWDVILQLSDDVIRIIIVVMNLTINNWHNNNSIIIPHRRLWGKDFFAIIVKCNFCSSCQPGGLMQSKHSLTNYSKISNQFYCILAIFVIWTNISMAIFHQKIHTLCYVLTDISRYVLGRSKFCYKMMCMQSSIESVDKFAS